MKKILYIILIIGTYCTNIVNISAQQPLGWGTPSTSEKRNYILTRTYLYEERNEYLDRIDYYDGLGRPVQSVQTVQEGKSDNDIITHQEYDEFGRLSNTWLPITPKYALYSYDYANSANLSTIKNSAKFTYSDDKPYSRVEYENSPLNRVIKQYGPGQDWHDNGKCISIDYLTNSANADLSCISYSVTGAGLNTSLKKSTNYTDGQLYVTKTTDEDGNISYEFKNKSEHTILIRQKNKDLYGRVITHDTYYVYDDYGNLCYVLPPMAAATTELGDNTNTLKQYVYLYKYDEFNRCVKKRIPGMDWVSYVYDKADQLIYSQDGQQYLKGEWSFSISDIFGRNALSGVCKKVKIGNNPEIPITIGCLNNVVINADWGNTTNTFKGYIINGAIPVTPIVYTINYYDGYTFLGKNNIPNDGSTQYNAQNGYGINYTKSAKGLLTGTLTAQILSNGTVASTYLYSVQYYDIKGQLVQTKSNNHLAEGIDKEYIAYNFRGQPLKRLSTHEVAGKTTQTELYSYDYYKTGQVNNVWHKLNNGDNTRIINNTYDDIGRLTSKTNVRTTNYTYNTRSWIKSIISPLFKQTLYYNEQFNPYFPASYSGNISAMTWQTGDSGERTYIFEYDELSRLWAANYIPENPYTSVDYLTYYDYDLNGNISEVIRYGADVVDNITLTYSGNQLLKADDFGSTVNLSTSADFKDYSKSATEYSYNTNGAMIKDLNKGISDIQYNSLNLPKLMDIKSPVAEARNEYTYSAGGKKLKIIQRWNPNFSTSPVIGSTINTGSLSMTKTTDYVGNKVYENGSLKRILIDGGYIENGQYYFYLTDHLGNNRVVINKSGQVIQENGYYPFGMAFAEGTTAEQGKQPYKYNSKELDQMHGLNLYDYSARYYDPAITRFTTVDPLAEKYYSISPYVYCNNNPIRFIDPTGMWYDDYFNLLGNYLGTDKDPNSSKVRIMDEETWHNNKIQDGLIDPVIGRANSSLHSESGITEIASMNIYKHYNPTVYNTLPNEKGLIKQETYLMQFQAAIDESLGAVLDRRIRVHITNMAKSRRSDDFNDIKSLFVHENDHGQLLKDIGPILYMRATRNKVREQFVEKRAIEAQMAHPTWDAGTQGLRDGIRSYANSLRILIHGLNIPSYKDYIPSSAPLKIKK